MIVNKRNNQTIANTYKKADNFFSRLIGLMGKKSMPDKEAYILYPCKGIHTFHMKFPIDVIFLDRNQKVIQIYRSLSPNKVIPNDKENYYAIEMKGGELSDEIQIGDEIIWH